MPTYAVTGTVTGTGGETTLKDDSLNFTKVEPTTYDLAFSTVQVVTFTVTGSGGSFPMKIKAPELPSTAWRHTGSMAILNFLGNTQTTTITFSQQPTSVDEGAEATFEVTATNIEAGATLQWELVHVGSISNIGHYDTSSAYGISGAVVLDNSASPKGTFKIKPLNDFTTNPTGQQKQFKIDIKRGGSVVASSNTVTVNDTSLGPVFTLTAGSMSMNEGDFNQFTVTATVPNPDYFSIRWGLVDVPDPYSKSLGTYFDYQGTIDMALGVSGSFEMQAYNDNLDNPVPKTFKVMIYSSTGTPLLATPVGPITVADTSKTPGISTIITSGSGTALTGGDLDGLYVYGVGLFATQEAGGGVSIFPDGSWFARDTTGASQSGKWFDPITPNIGDGYYIRVSSNPVVILGGGGTYDGDTPGWIPLNYTWNLFAQTRGYSCVDPNTTILIDENGTTKLAGDLIVDSYIYTMHEITKQWGYYKILHHEIVGNQQKTLITFEDGTTLVTSNTHKVYMGRDIWRQVFELKIGDRLVSHNSGMKAISSLQTVDNGNVVSMLIEHAHTYISNDIVSHNAKLGRGGNYGAEYERQFTVEISNEPSPSGTSYKSNTISIGGQVGIPL